MYLSGFPESPWSRCRPAARCRERRPGSFSRSFTLDGIQEDAIRASYQDGVLELILPKRQEVLPQCHKIQIQ